MKKIEEMIAVEALKEWKLWNAQLEGNPPYIKIDQDVELFGHHLLFESPGDGIDFLFSHTCGRCSNCSGVECGAFVGYKVKEALTIKRDAIASRLDQLAKESGITIVDGRFRYKVFGFPSGEETPTVVIGEYNGMSALDQQAIQNWLLRKAGLK